MGKIFEEINSGDKVYRTEIRCSELVEDENGEAIQELKLEKKVQWNDFYTYRLYLSDSTHAEVQKYNDVTVVPITVPYSDKKAIYAYIYSTSKKRLVEVLGHKFSHHKEEMNDLRKQTLLLLNKAIIGLNKVEALLSTLPDEEEEGSAMSEVEFAEMAL